jgi:hypothetical protein
LFSCILKPAEDFRVSEAFRLPQDNNRRNRFEYQQNGKGKVHEMIWQESSELRSSNLDSALESWLFRMADDN